MASLPKPLVLHQRQGVADDQAVLVGVGGGGVTTQHAVTPAQAQTFESAILEYIIQRNITLPLFGIATSR